MALTADQQDAARAAATSKKEKAEKEKARREAIKVAKTVLVKAGLPEDTKLNAEQRGRAVEAATKHAGLTGKALAAFVMDGASLTDQIKNGQEERATVEKADRTRANVTRSQDPEAADLAVKAKALAPDVKSAFLPKDAREFIDKFEQRKGGPNIVVKRTDVKDEEVAIKRVDLRKFAVDAEKDKDVRAALATLGKDSRLWGRKLGLFILATDAR